METIPREHIITEAIDAINEGRNVPKRIGDFNIKYVSTDAWRGYYEAQATKKSGWLKLEDGWMTGNWEDAPEDAKASNVEDKLNSLYYKVRAEGGELKVVFLPTSNVFSTAYDIFVRGINIEKLK